MFTEDMQGVPNKAKLVDIRVISEGGESKRVEVEYMHEFEEPVE